MTTLYDSFQLPIVAIVSQLCFSLCVAKKNNNKKKKKKKKQTKKKKKTLKSRRLQKWQELQWLYTRTYTCTIL